MFAQKIREAKGDEKSVVLKIYEGVPHAYTIQDEVSRVETNEAMVERRESNADFRSFSSV